MTLGSLRRKRTHDMHDKARGRVASADVIAAAAAASDEVFVVDDDAVVGATAADSDDKDAASCARTGLRPVASANESSQRWRWAKAATAQLIKRFKSRGQ